MLRSPRATRLALLSASLLAQPILWADTATDLSVTGYLFATGDLDINGNTASFGAEGTDPGYIFNYAPATDTISQSATSPTANWIWRRGPITGYQPQMQLGANNILTLFNPSTGLAGITLNPAGSVSLSSILGTTTSHQGVALNEGGANDQAPRKIFFNVRANATSGSYYKIASIRFVAGLAATSLNGWLQAGGYHANYERATHFEIKAFNMQDSTTSFLNYIKEGQGTNGLLVYKIDDSDGLGRDQYDIYLYSGFYTSHQGEVTVVASGNHPNVIITVWQSGLDTGTAVPSGTLQQPGSNYVIDTTGNVGIGTTTAPSAKLDVAGNAQISGNLNVTGTLSQGGSMSIASGQNLTFNNGGNAAHISSPGSGRLKFSATGNPADNSFEARGGGLMFPDGNKILDQYMGTLLGFGQVTNAVNYVQIENAISGTSPVVRAVGADTNIGVTITPKGTGNVKITSGFLGINNTANPVDYLHIKTSSTLRDGGITLQAYTDNQAKIGFQDSAGAYKWSMGYTGVQDHFTIANSSALHIAPALTILSGSANVGIGTNSPTSKLEVYGASPTATIRQNPNVAGGATLELTAAGSGSDANAATLKLHNTASIWSRTDGAGLRIGAADKSSTWATINSSGNVGIGTTNPQSRLTILSGVSGIDASGSSDRGQYVMIAGPNKPVGNATNSGQLGVFATDTGPLADTGGSISFGAPYNAAGNLAMNAAIKSGRDNATEGNYGGYLSLFTRPHGIPATERLRITSQGNVGIGTLSPAEKLDVAGNIKLSGNLITPNGNLSLPPGSTGNLLTTSGNQKITGATTFEHEHGNTVTIQNPAANTGFAGGTMAQIINSGISTSNKYLSFTAGYATTPINFGSLSFGANNSFVISNPSGGPVVLQPGGGNVGIGTGATTPANRLHIVDPGVSGSLRIENSNAGGYASIDLFDSGNTSAASVGYSNPAATNLPNSLMIGTRNTTAKVHIISGAATPTPRVTVDTDGDVGIGTINPAAKLDVNGSINITETLTQAGIVSVPIYARGSNNANYWGRTVYFNNTNYSSPAYAPGTTLSRGLAMLVINRDTLAVESNLLYDVYGSDTARNDMANALNALPNTKFVVITSSDAWRFNNALRAALLNAGASPDVFATEGRKAYALLGIPGIGAGNGMEAYNEVEDDAPLAAISTTFTRPGAVTSIPYEWSNRKDNTFLKNDGTVSFTTPVNINSTLMVNGASVFTTTGTQTITGATTVVGTTTVGGASSATQLRVDGSTGNVGVGTTSTPQKFNVAGTSSFAGKSWFSNGSNISGYSWMNAAITTDSIEIVNNNGAVSTSSPTLGFHRYGTGGPQFRLGPSGDNVLYLESANSNSARNPTPYGGGSNAYFDRFHVDGKLTTSGNVGIGTTVAPSAKLDVVGDAKVTTTLTVGGATTLNGNLAVNGLVTKLRVAQQGDISMGDFTASP